MTIIEINKKYYPIPTAWNELSQVQLLEVMSCLFIRKYITGEQVLLKLLKILAGMNWWQFYRANPAEMEEYFYLTEFLLKEKTELTKQLIPKYEGLYGPDDDFNNLIMQELAISDSLFMQWNENKENSLLLNEFCALLYRPGKRNYDYDRNPDGDPREEFNQNISAWNAKHIVNKWPMSVKLAIAYWYDACRWKLVNDNDEVFGGSNTGEVSQYGLVTVMLSVAETGALGDFSRVEKHYVQTVLMQINESIRKAKEQEKAMKQ